MGATPGWYPDPEADHTLRFWDGERWTDQRQLMPAQRQSMPIWKLSLAIGCTILGVVGVLLFVGNLVQSNRDLDCTTQQVEYSMGERSYYEVDADCRDGISP